MEFEKTGLEMLQEQQPVWHKYMYMAVASQQWNIVCFYLSMLCIWCIFSFSISQTVRQRNSHDLQRGLNVLKVILRYARLGEG